jgi:hypothetical protein
MDLKIQLSVKCSCCWGGRLLGCQRPIGPLGLGSNVVLFLGLEACGRICILGKVAFAGDQNDD